MAKTVHLTAEQLAARLGISEGAAYLLVRFGEETSLIEGAGHAVPKRGGKGRGAKIYAIPLDLGAQLGALWANRDRSTEVVVEAD